MPAPVVLAADCLFARDDHNWRVRGWRLLVIEARLRGSSRMFLLRSVLLRRLGPLGVALTAYDLWRRVPKSRRRQLRTGARRHVLVRGPAALCVPSERFVCVCAAAPAWRPAWSPRACRMARSSDEWCSLYRLRSAADAS
jgi:hypothetical protein